MKSIEPFADDESVLTLGELVIENGTESITMHGDIRIDRDRTGLERARILARTFADAVASLEKEDLPEKAPEQGDDGGSVPNPFA